MKNLAAYTAPGCNYPAYISVNKYENDVVGITVRATAVEGVCGETVSVLLTLDGYADLLKQLNQHALSEMEEITTNTKGEHLIWG